MKSLSSQHRNPPRGERWLQFLAHLLARSPNPSHTRALGFAASWLPSQPGLPFGEPGRRERWLSEGATLWARRRSTLALCRRLHSNGWQELHRAQDQGATVLFVGLEPLGWSLARELLGRFGPSLEPLAACPAGLGAALDRKDRRVGLGLDSVLAEDPMVLPVFARLEKGYFFLDLWRAAALPEKTTNEKVQSLEWFHRCCKGAASEYAQRLPKPIPLDCKPLDPDREPSSNG